MDGSRPPDNTAPTGKQPQEMPQSGSIAGPSLVQSEASLTLAQRVNEMIKQNSVMIFSKSFCPFCHKVKNLFSDMNVEYAALELDKLDEGIAIQDYLYQKTNQKTVPNVFVNEKHIGGCDATFLAKENGTLQMILDGQSYDYDLIIIGGGSGGLAMSKEAADMGKKVCVCDFVVPTPIGTKWGLGGTCVNVGCIPKKLMHKASILGEDIKEAASFGWQVPGSVEHSWTDMVSNVQGYIKSLNFGYRKSLREKKVIYKNAYAKFVDAHTLEVEEKGKAPYKITGQHIVVACGGRPNYLSIPGGMEYGITSDDLFSLKYHPGKTLIVGASYIALECAGFLHGIGVDVTVMVRSILLRGFDQQLAEMVGNHMKDHGVKFLRPCVPLKIEQINDGNPGLYKVYSIMIDSEKEICDEYNTIIYAIGRTAGTSKLNLAAAGIFSNTQNGKIVVNDLEKTSADNVYAIGDVVDGKPELTPVAIQAGVLLARRLYGNGKEVMDYVNIPTTVFTPLEYGFVGLSEEDAIAKYGPDNIEVFHSFFNPLEFALSNRDNNKCYGKLVCVKEEQNRVVGFHVLGPNAGEITQGFAIGVKLGARQRDFAQLVGIHPTNAEIFTTMKVTKASGASVQKTDC